MCGRFVLWITLSLPEHYAAPAPAEPIRPSYNIAPGQDVVAVRQTSSGPRIVRLHWGLIPSWTRDPAKARKSINARSETAWDKPSFRAAMRNRRCLVSANGFLEWQRTGTRKQPYLVRFENLELFSMAGIWESWKNPETGKTIASCAILTIRANEAVAAIHDRMPVIIMSEAYTLWLDPDARRDRIDALLQPFTAARTLVQPVSARVNNPSNNDPECIVPVLLPDTAQH